ncbi:MAG: SDR family NAD(P)-dependent oxidoreductase [Actinomycetota bacterium]
MRVLVTGAAGFIGSHLCRRLVADGHEVVGFDDLSDGTLDNLSDVPEVRFVEGDLRDEMAVRKAAAGCGVILHHGAMKSVPRSVRLPEATTDVNVRGTLNVLLAARDESAAVVNASSSSVYGDQEVFPLREDMEPRPRSPYAATKLAAEAVSRAWWHSYSVPAVSFRYFNVYGPGQDPNSEYAAVIPRFTVACLTGQPPVIYGDGEQARDFTYIDDVIEANIQVALAPEQAAGRVLNVAGGRKPTTVNRLLEMIAAELGVETKAVHEPPRDGDIRLSEADVSLARKLIGYEPAVGIDDGIRRTVAWFQDHAPLAR